MFARPVSLLIVLRHLRTLVHRCCQHATHFIPKAISRIEIVISKRFYIRKAFAVPADPLSLVPFFWNRGYQALEPPDALGAPGARFDLTPAIATCGRQRRASRISPPAGALESSSTNDLPSPTANNGSPIAPAPSPRPSVSLQFSGAMPKTRRTHRRIELQERRCCLGIDHESGRIVDILQ